MVTIIVFVLILGFLIFVHELGHFAVARRNGIRTNEFGLGFPPRAVGVQFLYKDSGCTHKNAKKPFRIVWGSKDGDDEQEQKDLAEAEKKGLYGGTVYSLNWIPIGGFVKIKGEDGEHRKDRDSFASKSPWTRIKVLGAGVVMNFLAAWLFFSLGFMLGAPQQYVGKISITEVEKNSPAELMGIKAGDIPAERQMNDGDVILIKSVEDLQRYVAGFRGKEMTLDVIRDGKNILLKGTPRTEVIEGQGSLGIHFTQIDNERHGFFEALYLGLGATWSMVLLTLGFIFQIFAGNKEAIKNVGGVIRIAQFTGDVIPLGLSALAQFVAMLSVNLAVLNILPIPALDGGRILFVLIEKIKGSPVKTEQLIHGIGLALLLVLMVWVTYHDVIHLNLSFLNWFKF